MYMYICTYMHTYDMIYMYIHNIMILFGSFMCLCSCDCMCVFRLLFMQTARGNIVFSSTLPNYHVSGISVSQRSEQHQTRMPCAPFTFSPLSLVSGDGVPALHNVHISCLIYICTLSQSLSTPICILPSPLLLKTFDQQCWSLPHIYSTIMNR